MRTKRNRVVLSIEDKLKICDLVESGRSWSIIGHTNMSTTVLF